MTRGNMAGRILSAYAEQETWKRDHDDAMECYRIEEAIPIGIHVFQILMETEAFVMAKAGKAEGVDVKCELADCTRRTRSWIETSRRFASAAVVLAAKGYQIPRLDEFSALLEEAIAIVENSELEDHIPPLSELMKLVSPGNPDPARYGD